MKKQAIIIQCHNRPNQINEIICFFDKEQFDFYIHVDKKSKIDREIICQENVFVVPNEKRVFVRWGDFSQVSATLACFKMLNGEKYSYVHLMSGADFPVVASQSLTEQLHKDDSEYIEANPFPCDAWSWGGTDRVFVRYPKWVIERPKFKIRRILRVLYREFIMRTHIFKKKVSRNYKFYGGSQWFSITGKMVEWMKKYLQENPTYSQVYKNGCCVDEVFFSTLAMMSPYARNVKNENKRYIDWTDSKSGGPRLLKENDIPEMMESGAFFARKIEDDNVILKIKNSLKQGASS